ncbi:MAG TPA: N-6 DNA methylase [Bryobacteraceae bacterium]|nr:N-6 DNA methylase [Bryobacteraceae bacterium]
MFEYFLYRFAQIEGKSKREWFTLPFIVQLLAEIVEPLQGRVYDPACGSGGTFIASARFISARNLDPRFRLSIHGAERINDTGRLARMNLAIHGLSGEILHGAL